MLGHTSNQNFNRNSTLSKKLKLILSFSVWFVWLKTTNDIEMKISFYCGYNDNDSPGHSSLEVRNSKVKFSNKSLLNNPLAFTELGSCSTFTFTYKGFTLLSNLFPDLTDGLGIKRFIIKRFLGSSKKRL